MARKQKQEGVGIWVAIVVLFAVGLWPIALVLLFVKLFGSDGKAAAAAPPRASAPAWARLVRIARAEARSTRSPRELMTCIISVSWSTRTRVMRMYPLPPRRLSTMYPRSGENRVDIT